MQVLADLPNLQYLTLDDNPLTDRALAKLGRSKTLRELHLQKTLITDAGISHLSGTSLLNLDLCETEVGNDVIIHLAKIKTLRELNIRHTKVTDESVPLLEKMKNLQVLVFWNTEITEQGRELLERALPHAKLYGPGPSL